MVNALMMTEGAALGSLPQISGSQPKISGKVGKRGKRGKLGNLGKVGKNQGKSKMLAKDML